jgi:predicted nucleic acid-binding protein
LAVRSRGARMIIVDSDTWVDFLNRTPTPHVERLDLALEEEEDLAILRIIITEGLQGFRSVRGSRRARRVLLALPVCEPRLDCHVRAANLFGSLRRKSVTVRGVADCIIAQTCLDADAELPSPDADYRRIARYMSLRL